MDAHELPVWARLVALMLVGDGVARPFSGVLRTRADDGGDVRARVWVDGRCVRRETLDGEVRWIQDSDTAWIFEQAGDERPSVHGRQLSAFVLDDDVLLLRRSGLLEPDDRHGGLVREPEPTRFLGRDAWTVELRLEYWKTGHVTWTVDARTGMVLREVDAAGTVLAEWEELQVGEPAPPGSFTWTGPTRESRPDDSDDERERWHREAEDSGLLGLVLPVPIADVMIHEHGEGGRWRASLDFMFAHATVMRDARGEPPVYEGSGGHEHRWSDERWDWLVVAPAPLDDATLAELRDRLPR